MQITVKHRKGKHHSDLKSRFWMNLASIFRWYFTVTFDQEAMDALMLVTDQDRYDWCKLIGRRNFIPHRHAGSWVAKEEQIWVYSIREDRVVVSDYYRKKGYMIFPERYTFLAPGKESPVFCPSLLCSFRTIPPYYCGSDSDGNGMGGVAPANFSYTVNLYFYRAPKGLSILKPRFAC